MKNISFRTIIISFLPLIFVYFGLTIIKNMVITFIFYHIIVCLLLPLMDYCFFYRKSASLHEILGLGRIDKRSILTGVLLGIAYFGSIILIFYCFKKTLLDKFHIDTALSAIGFSKKYFFLLAVYFIFFNSIVEELFWRGYLYYQYGKKIRIPFSSVVISFFFIQYHFITIGIIFSFQVALIFIPVLFIVSIIWCYLRHINSNIYAAIISHFMADLALIVVYYMNILY